MNASVSSNSARSTEKGTELHLMVRAQIECGVYKALVACEAGDARP